MRAWVAGWAVVVACSNPASDEQDDTDPVDTEPTTVPWRKDLPDAATLSGPRDLVLRRAVFHVHSPYSHDACDGEGWADGVLNTACRDDLRDALCTLRFDGAFITDHPDYGDAQPFESLFHPAPTDTLVRDGDDIVANEIACEGGHVVRWRAGFEDDLMPVALRHHVDPDEATRHGLLNGGDLVSQDAMRAAGGHVLVAHPEGRSIESLQALQDDGLHGIEVFNLHAMFAPDLRKLLGLDPFGFAGEIGPFLTQEPGLEPDLYVLGVLAEQGPTQERIDTLLQRGNLMLTGGTDAHQNVLASPLSDGERGDSYRRMLSWFSTMLLATDTSLAALDAAVEAKRSFVAFEALGTPDGFDFHLRTEAGDEVEQGGDSAVGGELVVTCPTLAPGSPRGEEAPDIQVQVIKDGAVWQTGCGSWEAGPGAYRVKVTMTPHHLATFLGEDPSRWMRAYPWIYSSGIRVGL